MDMAFAKNFGFAKLLGTTLRESHRWISKRLQQILPRTNSMLVYFCAQAGPATIKSSYRLPDCFNNAQLFLKKQVADVTDYLYNIFFYGLKISAKHPYSKGQPCSQHGSRQTGHHVCCAAATLRSLHSYPSNNHIIRNDKRTDMKGCSNPLPATRPKENRHTKGSYGQKPCRKTPCAKPGRHATIPINQAIYL